MCALKCPDEQRIKTMKDSTAAHRVTLYDDCLVYERDTHMNFVTKNFICSDQYGSRYNGVAEEMGAVPATKVHVPLAKCNLEVVPLDDMTPPLWLDSMYYSCCKPKLNGDAIVITAGDGVRVQIGIVDLGPGSNKDAFLARFNDLKQSASIASMELETAYEQWYWQRLNNAGTMASANSHRVIGALAPGDATPSTQPGFWGGIGNVDMHNIGAQNLGRSIEGHAHGMFAVRGGKFSNFMNNQDHIVALRGTQVQGQNLEVRLSSHAAQPPCCLVLG